MTIAFRSILTVSSSFDVDALVRWVDRATTDETDYSVSSVQGVTYVEG